MGTKIQVPTGLKTSVRKQNIHKNTGAQGEVHKQFRRPTQRTATQESITEQFRGLTGRPVAQRYKAVQEANRAKSSGGNTGKGNPEADHAEGGHWRLS